MLDLVLGLDLDIYSITDLIGAVVLVCLRKCDLCSRICDLINYSLLLINVILTGIVIHDYRKIIRCTVCLLTCLKQCFLNRVKDCLPRNVLFSL